MMIIEISAAIVTFAFVILVVYIVILINALCGTLARTDQVIAEARKQLDEIAEPAKKVIECADAVSLGLKEKMEALTSIFHAVSNIGDVWESKTTAWKNRVFSSMQKERRVSHVQTPSFGDEEGAAGENSCADLCDLVGAGIRLWHKVKNK